MSKYPYIHNRNVDWYFNFSPNPRRLFWMNMLGQKLLKKLRAEHKKSYYNDIHLPCLLQKFSYFTLFLMYSRNDELSSDTV